MITSGMDSILLRYETMVNLGMTKVALTKTSDFHISAVMVFVGRIRHFLT